MIDLDPQARDESTVALLGRLALVEELLGASWATWRHERGRLGQDVFWLYRWFSARKDTAMEAASMAISHYEREARAIAAELQRRQCCVTLADLPDGGNAALNAAVREWLG